MVKAGNRVVFDRDENQKCTSEIFNKPTGKKIKINEVGPPGSEHYEFDMWVPTKKGTLLCIEPDAVFHLAGYSSNDKPVIPEEDDPDTPDIFGKNDNSGFQRLVDIL